MVNDLIAAAIIARSLEIDKIVACATDTHTIITQCLSAGDGKRGDESGGDVRLGKTRVHDFTILETKVIVPVNPNDGWIGVTGFIRDFDTGGAAGINSAHKVMVVTPVGS